MALIKSLKGKSPIFGQYIYLRSSICSFRGAHIESGTIYPEFPFSESYRFKCKAYCKIIL